MIKIKDLFFKILVVLLFVLNIFLLLYKLGDIPRGIHVDEAGSYYDAFCLVKYGVDRFLYKYPVYLINYGGGQSALYTYLACVSFKVLGGSLRIEDFVKGVFKKKEFCNYVVLFK